MTVFWFIMLLAVALLALIVGVLAHLRSESYRDAFEQESERLEEQFQNEIGKLEARIVDRYGG